MFRFGRPNAVDRDSPIEVTPVRTWRERRRFLHLPWRLHRGDPNWVPPLRDMQRRLVGYAYHPFHQNAVVETFVACRGKETVGRIAAVVNFEHERRYGRRQGFFGFFESIDDGRVSAALFDAARNWLSTQGAETLRGPVNPSMNYECGLLVEGFDDPPAFMMPYNPPYYPTLFESYGFRKVQDLYAYEGYAHEVDAAIARWGPIAKRAKEMFGIHMRSVRRERFLEDILLFLDVFNRSCTDIWDFVPLTQDETIYTAHSLKRLLLPELISFAEIDGRLAGIQFGLPDYNPRIKAIDGRLFPFGVFKLLSKNRDFKRVRVLATTVLPEYQSYGIPLVMLDRLATSFTRLGLERAEFSWVTESNAASNGSLTRGGLHRRKTYRIYDWQPNSDDSVPRAQLFSAARN